MADDKTTTPENDKPWLKKSVSEYKDIVLKQIDLIRVESSKQVQGEGTVFTQQDGKLIPMNLVNQKEVIKNCIVELRNLMERYFDTTIVDSLKVLDKEMEDKKIEWINFYIAQQRHPKLKTIAIKFRCIPLGDGNDLNPQLSNMISGRMESDILEIYKKIYRELLLLFDRKGELSGKKMLAAY